MSRTVIFAAQEDGEMRPRAIFLNASLGFYLLWHGMARRYLGWGDRELYRWPRRDLQPVWDLAHDPAVPVEDRISMAVTFDDLLVRPADYFRVAVAMRHSSLWVGQGNHLDAQASVLLSLIDRPDARAVGWWQHSTAPNPWFVSGPDEFAEGRLYNIDRDEGHVWLFEDLLADLR